MKNKENHISAKEKLVTKLSLPKDVCNGVARISMTGNEEAWVENYRGILEYSENRILLQTKTCQIDFEGRHLSIDYYTGEDMKICGCIQRIQFL